MLKEYRFNLSYEYYSFRDKPEDVTHRVNDHKVSGEIFDRLFNKAMSILPLDITTMYLWKNHKTGSYTRSEHWTFNEETYDY